jgi:hypothetical protein
VLRLTVNPLGVSALCVERRYQGPLAHLKATFQQVLPLRGSRYSLDLHAYPLPQAEALDGGTRLPK